MRSASAPSNCASPSTTRYAAIDAYEALMKDVAATEGTADRIAALYDGMIPESSQRYSDYIAATDPILDEPSIVIMERIVRRS